jgi:hypothetical protein
MRIDEFAAPMDDSLPFDVVDDVAIFMRNDPMFYRKQLFPAIMKMKGRYDAGKSCVAEQCVGEACSNAVESYCRAFDLGKRPEELLTAEEQKVLVQKIYSEEMTQIRNGAY